MPVVLCLLFVIFYFANVATGGARFCMNFANNTKPFSRSKCCLLFLFIAWILGLLVGYSVFFTNESFFLSLMPGAVTEPMSIVGLFAVIFLPLFFSYYSFLTDKPVIVLIVCFFKSAAFSFSGILVSHYFISASWLVLFLYLFSDTCCLAALSILWVRRFCCVNISGFGDVLNCALFGLGVAAVDYFAVSPFLECLF